MKSLVNRFFPALYGPEHPQTIILSVLDVLIDFRTPIFAKSRAKKGVLA